MIDKNNLDSRIDRYINAEYADHFAVGLILELRAHLKAANKGAERLNSLYLINAKAFWQLNDRVKALELKMEANDELARGDE